MKKTILIAAVIAVLDGICGYAAVNWDVIEFATPQGDTSTNLPDYPITGRLASDAKHVFVNRNEIGFDAEGHDFFYVQKLRPGWNKPFVEVYNDEGLKIGEYTRDIYYSSDFSLEGEEVLYVNSRYYDPNVHDGVLVMGLSQKQFLGIIPNKQIRGITVDGNEIVLYEGERYSTTTNSPSGKILPGVKTDDWRILFSKNFAYRGKDILSLESNEVVGKLPADIGKYYCDITADGGKIFYSGGCIDLASNVLTGRNYMGNSTVYWQNLASDPLGFYVFNTSCSWATGVLNILLAENATVLKTYYIGDYPREVAFSPDARQAYFGVYGNTYYGWGGISIIDMNSLNLGERFPLHGAGSIAVAKDGTLYASGFLSNNINTHGQQELRGIVELTPSEDRTTFVIKRTYFVSLLSTTSEPYYWAHNFFYKPAKKLNQ